jgi:hypothetical protein
VRALRFAFLALVAGISAPAGVAAGSTLSFLDPPAEVTYEKEAGAYTGSLVVLLQNQSASGGQLELELIGPDGQTASAGQDAVEGFRLTVTPPAGTPIRPRSLNSLQVEVEQRTPTMPESVRLVARIAGARPVGPAVITLTPGGPAISSPAPLAFAQTQATMNVSRALGPLVGLARRVPRCGCQRGFFGDSVRIGTTGRKPSVIATLVNSDSGGTAQVVVRRDNRSSSTLAMRMVTDRGKYVGNVTIDPEAEKAEDACRDT